MLTLAKRRAVERRIVKRVVKAAFAAGYTLKVDDGEDVLELNDVASVNKVMFSVDDENLLVFKDKRKIGRVYFVYGNDGTDVICDYTTNLEAMLADATAFADRLDSKLRDVTMIDAFGQELAIGDQVAYSTKDSLQLAEIVGFHKHDPKKIKKGYSPPDRAVLKVLKSSKKHIQKLIDNKTLKESLVYCSNVVLMRQC